MTDLHDPSEDAKQLTDLAGGLLAVLTAVPLVLGYLFVVLLVICIPIGIVLAIVRDLF